MINVMSIAYAKLYSGAGPCGHACRSYFYGQMDIMVPFSTIAAR